ncbi:hypothetical protein AgCh_022317 [Apium graveolens]
METRSRKRAEATSSAPNSSSSGPTTRSAKRARTSGAAGSSANSGSPVTPVIVTRSRSLKMEESSGSASRGGGRRGKNVEKDSSSKGKEKEHEVRIRERNRESRDIERSLGLNLESTGTGGEGNDDDNDSEDGVGMLHQNLTSASSALQGLLRKLGAGLDDLLPSSAMAAASSQQSGRLKKILLGLEADGEEGKQVEALTQLCEILSIGTEDSLSTFSVDSFVPVLVNMLTYMDNADIMLLAARAITHLCDVLPSSCTAVVHYGAVDSLVNKLLTIEYMDLAEQSLQALKKISQEHPTACLRAGALMAVLQYLDFFSTGVQRVALTTAANMCKKLPADAAEFVTNAVPLLSQLLQEHDAKVIELASVCLTRIVESFASSPDRLDELCNHGLITQVASLISTSSSGGGQATLSTSTYTGLVRLLSTCASGSPLGSKNLLLLGISGIIKDILSGSGLVANMSVSPALSSPPEQIFEIVNLANELLPPLPQGTISLPSSSNVSVKGSLISVPLVDSEEQDDSTGTEISTREKLLNEQPELLQQFGIDILPVLIQIYGSSVNGPVRHKCLSVIGKLMYFSSADMIQGLLSVTNISSFLAGVLAWKDPQVLIPALQIADILMNKLPETFSKIFVREGVVHAVDMLILAGPHGTALPVQSSCQKENDSVPGSSSRSRRNRRRGGNLNFEGITAEDSKHSGSAVGSPPNPVENPTLNSSLRMEVSSSAQAFKDKYFPSDPGSVGAGLSDDLLHLKSLCSRLNAGVSNQGTKSKGKSKASGPCLTDTSAIKEENMAGIISEILTELSKGDGVSTFEFIGSGVVAALLNYLSCGFSSKDKKSKSSISKNHEQAMRRYKSFISVALPSGPQTKNVPPMSILVQKLQNALSSLERFPVVLSHTARSSGGNARMSSGLSALVQPFKLRLCRAQGEKSLRDYSSNVVLIDPLASLATVEDFLWPRVQRNESGQKPLSSAPKSESKATHDAGVSSPSNLTPASATRRQSTRSRTSISIGDNAKKELAAENIASSSKGKGKAVLRTTPEDGRGPHTRKAARRKAAVDKDVEMKAVEVESSSEGEDLEASPVDVDDEMVIEDDNISDDEDDDDQDDVLGDGSSRVSMMDVVHDVKLGDSADDSPNPPSTSDKQVNTAGVSSSRTTTLRSSESSDLRSGTAFGSRGAMSFAAAAMAGLSSSNSRGISATREQPGRPQISPRLLFSAGGKHLNKHLPIYQAIQRQLVLDEDGDDRYNGNDFISSDGSRLWGDIYTITYKRADSQTETASVGTINSSSPSKSRKGVSASSSSIDSSKQHVSLLDSIFRGELPCDLEKSNPTYDILALLRVLEGLNELAPRLHVQSKIDSFSEGNISSLNEFSSSGVWVPSEEFINTKLTPKLGRQLQDALALCSGSLPSWCYQLTKACPFLFPFETRRQYFYSTAFGLSRALYRLQQQQVADGHGSMNEREVRVGRLQRQKVRVSRNRILDSAAKVMEMYCGQKAVLEVEYFGEVGTGLGPTLEFYTILSHELQKVGLEMWRSNSSSDNSMMEVDEKSSKKISDTGLALKDIIQAPLGLFPRPWSTGADVSNGRKLSKVVEHFRLLGRVLAKALQDGRLLDLPLSTAFYKLLLGQDLDLHDIISFDAELGKTLLEMQALVYRKKYLESMGANDQIADLRFHGTLIEDLCLDFTLPGYPDYILKPGEENVDINSLEEYVALVVDATVGLGIRTQLEALRTGFSQVFDISSLQIFTAKELDYLLCGRRELWETETLADHIKFDHGYTAKSPPIVNLLEIMGEFTPEQQRAFCQFVTGAPRLPPGGLAVLNPKLTIVRKHSSTIANTTSNGIGALEYADDDLPSVMTCANYLKLPPYSTKEVMYKKLMYAISEGQGSFDLS